MNQSNRTEAQTIMELGSALSDPLSAAAPNDKDSIPFVVVPEGYAVKDIESLFQFPTRSRGEYVMLDADSFITLVKALKDPGLRLYGTQQPPCFTAVFNDSSHAAGPGWSDHRAVYAAPLSIEWSTWTASNGKVMTQADFARFIEDNSIDIAHPPAADMLEISRTLEAKKQVNFASGVRLDNGQSHLSYEEEIRGTAAKGQLQIPEHFTVGVSVLQNGPKYALQARLRYRIDGGKLTMWYDLLRPHKLVEDAVRDVAKKIGDELGLPVLSGLPRLSTTRR